MKLPFNLLYILCVSLVACNRVARGHFTPKEFVNHVAVPDSSYIADNVGIIDSAHAMLLRRDSPYDFDEYFDSTELLVDTIIYDSSLQKIVTFILARNPVGRIPKMESDSSHYYNANAFMGRRKSPYSHQFELVCLCEFSETNFTHREAIRESLRRNFFFSRSGILDRDGKPMYPVNVDDRRFWTDTSGWPRAFDE